MQIFCKILTCFKFIFSSGRQTRRFHFCVRSPVREVAVTDTVAYQIKFEWSNACVYAIKKVQTIIWPKNNFCFLIKCSFKSSLLSLYQPVTATPYGYDDVLFHPSRGAKSHKERSNWIRETTRFWDTSETCRSVAGIYISMGINTSIDLTRATVISSGGRVGARQT